MIIFLGGNAASSHARGRYMARVTGGLFDDSERWQRYDEKGNLLVFIKHAWPLAEKVRKARAYVDVLDLPLTAKVRSPRIVACPSQKLGGDDVVIPHPWPEGWKPVKATRWNFVPRVRYIGTLQKTAKLPTTVIHDNTKGEVSLRDLEQYSSFHISFRPIKTWNTTAKLATAVCLESPLIVRHRDDVAKHYLPEDWPLFRSVRDPFVFPRTWKEAAPLVKVMRALKPIFSPESVADQYKALHEEI